MKRKAKCMCMMLGGVFGVLVELSRVELSEQKEKRGKEKKTKTRVWERERNELYGV